MRVLAFSLKLHRFGVIVVVAGLLLLVGGLVRLGLVLTSTAAECARAGGAFGLGDCSSLALLGTLGDDDVRRLLSLAGLTPFICGTLLGAPIVAREFDGRTAALAWSLAASRAQWLASVTLPLAVVAILLLGAVGISADWVESAHTPSVDAASSMADYGLRGPLLISRFLLAFALALLAGALVRRTLAAVLVAVALNTILFFALSGAVDKWVTPIVIDRPESPKDLVGLRVVEPVFVRADGSRLSIEAAEIIDPTLSDPSLGHLTDYAIDGSQYPDVQLREAFLTSALTVLMAGFVLVVVRRLRPN